MSQQTPNYDNNVDYMALAMKAATTGNTDIAMSFLESREAKVKNEGLGEYNAEDDRDLMEAIAKMPDEGKGKLVSLLSGAYTTD
ncbi:MAG: hypothetical protein IKY94_15155 [Lachnospiraceae bacterium]|jgi:hypothetical protein|nr:hypothetical protein [Lachnospiraceae bacterium]